MSSLHPRIRLPLWAALAVPLAAYVYRSYARGWDLRLDLPQDLLVLALYALVLTVALWSRRAAAAEKSEKHSGEQQDAEDGQG